MVTSGPGPPPRVLAAFGLTGPARPLAGGRGTSWRVGDVVLKPDVDPAFQQWLGTELARVEQDGFRLPEVRRSVDGAWVAGGWGACSALPGAPPSGSGDEWSRVIAAGRALHTATAAVARPGLLDLRTDPWARADRAAWSEAPREVGPDHRGLVRRLDAALAPLGPAQLVHGDLTTNVLITPGEPPSIIDFSPYWRPPAYAEGIVVADALCWHATPVETVHELGVPLAAVARALLFRLLTLGVRNTARGAAPVEDELGRYAAALDALGL